MDPIVLVSDIGIDARNRRQRVRPQRCWLIRRSAMAMLSASHGHSSTTSATDVSPSVICRFSSALARRTRFACCNARMCCGAGAVANASIEPPRGSSSPDEPRISFAEHGPPRPRCGERVEQGNVGAAASWRLYGPSPALFLSLPGSRAACRPVRNRSQSRRAGSTLNHPLHSQKAGLLSRETLVHSCTRPKDGKPRRRAKFVLWGGT